MKIMVKSCGDCPMFHVDVGPLYYCAIDKEEGISPTSPEFDDQKWDKHVHSKCPLKKGKVEVELSKKLDKAG